MNRVHNRGLELPVYPADTLFINPKHTDPAESDVHGTGTFVRRVDMFAEGFSSLKKALNTADEVFARVAGHTGAIVVEHHWGFLDRPRSVQQQKLWPLVPPEFTLIAEIEIIRDIQPLTADQKEKLEDYSVWDTKLAGNGYTWIDYSSGQFINGLSITQPEPQLILSDIEPLIAAIR